MIAFWIPVLGGCLGLVVALFALSALILEFWHGAAAIRAPPGIGVVVAYILVQTDVGVIGDVAGEIAGISGMLAAEAVTGPYDVTGKAEANSLDELGRLVIQRIQSVAGASSYADLPRPPRVIGPKTTHEFSSDCMIVYLRVILGLQTRPTQR